MYLFNMHGISYQITIYNLKIYNFKISCQLCLTVGYFK